MRGKKAKRLRRRVVNTYQTQANDGLLKRLIRGEIVQKLYDLKNVKYKKLATGQIISDPLRTLYKQAKARYMEDKRHGKVAC
jgi:hypothetical protein